MMSRTLLGGFLSLVLGLSACQKQEKLTVVTWDESHNLITDASGLDIYQYPDFTAINVHEPWPDSKDKFQYIVGKDAAKIPDSLKKYPFIQLPITRVISTSTTHIPSLEYLGVLDHLIGFPNTNYISSKAAQERVKSGQISELGAMDHLNIERVVAAQPQVIIGHNVDNNQWRFDAVKKLGIPVLFNGDWNDKSPLGKAEWIKLFGVLFEKNDEAKTIYERIKADYLATIELAKTNVTKRPTVLSGGMYEKVWYAPAGESWAANYLDLAGGDYLWKNSAGTGSLALHFEEVLAKGKSADFWITSGSYLTVNELKDSYPHYSEFNALKNKNVYSFYRSGGENSGILFYELANARPDLVLKDLLKILHPELVPNHQLVFYQRIN